MKPRLLTQKGQSSSVASDALESHVGVVVRNAVSPAFAADASLQVLRARDDWTSDFHGEQFALGRAFYTHFETDREAEYFRNVERADEQVERWLPGLQAKMRELFATLSGGRVRQRHGFCGAGVHIFPHGGELAKRGGVVHYDVEGLSPEQLRRRAPARTLVLMLTPALRGGGLRIFAARYNGQEHPSDAELASPHVLLRYGPGDLLLMESYRLHQIRPFSGTRDRISATLHGVEIDDGVWETWF